MYIPKLLMTVNFRLGFEVWESILIEDCFSGVTSDDEFSDWFCDRYGAMGLILLVFF